MPFLTAAEFLKERQAALAEHHLKLTNIDTTVREYITRAQALSASTPCETNVINLTINFLRQDEEIVASYANSTEFCAQLENDLAAAGWLLTALTHKPGREDQKDGWQFSAITISIEPT